MLTLTPGNRKLGGPLIWGFGLPSGTATICVGMSPTCRRVCYAVRTEQYRKSAAAAYARNYAASRRKGFARRVRATLLVNGVRVVRVHTGGDFYSARYARKWLAVMARTRRVRFYFYTRSWRVPAIRPLLDAMAALPNVRAWYSADADTGMPADLPPRVRIAWLLTDQDAVPPPAASLAFRVGGLRSLPVVAVAGVPVCPAEDGVPRSVPATCDRCRLCWRSEPVGTAAGVLRNG